jgi:hypothetical protein
VKDPKSGEPYEVALSPRAQKALAAVKGSGAYVFEKFRRAENPRDWSGSVRQRLQYLCEQVDVPYGRAIGGVTFHWSTRRTGATRLIVGKRVPIPSCSDRATGKRRTCCSRFTPKRTRRICSKPSARRRRRNGGRREPGTGREWERAKAVILGYGRLRPAIES